jgi:Xaa-Pro aminopeptidase
LAKHDVDAILVTKPQNVRYLSGYTGEDACLLIMSSKRYLLTDERFALQARQDVEDFKIVIAGLPLPEVISRLTKKTKIRRLGFESSHLSYASYERIKSGVPGAVVVPVYGMIEALRQVKDEAEMALIRDSVNILENAVTYFRSILKPGLSENDLAARTEYFIRAASGEWASFELIVASGPNSAYPHARPGDRIIRPNDMVLLDLGVSYEGYKSDLTRVFFLGKIDSERKRIYGIVKEAQRRSIKAIKPGAKISDIDKIARGFINGRGYGKKFGHSLGHGIGLEVHESPSISSRNHAVLKPGMVFTVEPAVYIPGWGGIRIEDMALVTAKGCEVLTDDIDK